jgi:CRISPR/Cas system-associated exonuclease Cas4 (RecB family)
MYQLMAGWNLVSDILENDEATGSQNCTVKLRGYSRRVALPGDFRLFLKNYPNAYLSVTDITGGICPQSTDAYLNKSPHSPVKGNSPKARALKKKQKSGCYQQRAGDLFEDVLSHGFKRVRTEEDSDYTKTKFRRQVLMQNYRNSNGKQITQFNAVEPLTNDGGNPNWFMKQMECCIGQQLGAFLIQESLRGEGGSAVRKGQVKLHPEIILSDPQELGIKKAIPDFVVQSAKLIGDVKTGKCFQYKYMLTCAGYAMAFERKRKRNIDWGAIIFEPTEICTALHQPLTFPQLYLFRITDELRLQFIEKRDKIYRQNEQVDIPKNLIKRDGQGVLDPCEYCQRSDQCAELYAVAQ